MGLVSITESGINSKRKNYIPTKQAVHYVVDLIRSELLEDGEITEDIACLVALLERSKIMKEYFSSFEQKEIMKKLLKDLYHLISAAFLCNFQCLVVFIRVSFPCSC